MVPVRPVKAGQTMTLDVARPLEPRVAPVPSIGDEDALNTLVALVGDDLAACNHTIVARMDSPVALIPQLAAHLVAAGGKRLRPLLTLASARLCGYPGSAGGARHVALAACVEFIHTATLLHDDVVDESALRRGMASANAVFGNQASVLVGDFLFARAFQLMVEDGSLRVLGILSQAAATIAEGEVLQLVTQNDLSTPEARYLDVVKGKTAALFAAACQVGAVVAERPADEEAALAEYGLNLGIAFQLVDDALDYAADQATLGKTVGDDFREGKITLPVLLAYAAGDQGPRVLAPHHRGKRATGRRSAACAGAHGGVRRHRHDRSARRPFRDYGEVGAEGIPGRSLAARIDGRGGLYDTPCALGAGPFQLPDATPIRSTFPSGGSERRKRCRIPPNSRPPVAVGHVRLNVVDVGAAARWLETVGLRPIATMDGLAVLEVRGGTHVVVRQAELPPTPGAGAPFDLMVDDIDAVHRDYGAKGLSPSPIQRGRIHDSFSLPGPDGWTFTINSSHAGSRPV